MAEKYYAMIDGEQRGPFSLEELPGAGVRPSTYIWCKGLPDWQKAEENADICRHFRNHLYDLMHPSAPEISDSNLDAYKVQPDSRSSSARTRYDVYLQETGETLPTVDEIEESKDKTAPPVSMIGYAWLVTLLCCLPAGIVALVYAYKSKNAWKSGENVMAHDYCRISKMWTGISFFIGLIGYGILLAFIS